MSVLDDVALVAEERGATATIRPRDGAVLLTMPRGQVKEMDLARVRAEASRLRARPRPEVIDPHAPRAFTWDNWR